MCGRYWIEPEENPELMEIIAQMQRIDVPVKTEGEIFPGDRVPVLCRSRAGNVRPFAMEWGYRFPDGKRIINARSETAGERPMFRDGMAHRRCLLPMSAYFEWEKREDGKQKYRIAPADGGVHYLAGLYRFEGTNPVCTVLTAASTGNIAFIHHRMPVILSGAEKETWLDGGKVDFGRELPLCYREA